MVKKLKGAFLVLTNKCNLRCKYCYQGSSPNVNTKNELKKEEWKKILLQLKGLKAKKLSFVGGEPFLYKDFWNILEFAKKKGFEIKIFTNGTFLNEKVLKKLKKLNIKLSFNLNSHNKKFQDFFQEKGSWEETVNAIEQCKKQKIEFEIASPIMKGNLRNLDKFIKFCTKLGAKRIRLVPLILMGNAVNLKRFKISKKQIKKLNKKIKNRGIKVTVGCRVCEAGINYITIQPNGDVNPCSINQVKLGNIKNSSLKEILKSQTRGYAKVCAV